MTPTIPMDKVIPILEAIADEVILPRYRVLAAGEVTEKSPGELVTIADREAEILITRELKHLRPDAVVIGEEAVETHPSLLDALKTDATCWVVDPLDGTANFVNGRREFAVMVALVQAGETIGSWIWLPLDRIGYVAERGSGAFRNGKRLLVPPSPTQLEDIRGAVDHPADHALTSTPSTQIRLEDMRGAVLQKFLTPEQRALLAEIAPRFREIGPGQYCAGIEYPRIAEGKQEFVRFHRLRPWDHAPGTLLLEEAGGEVRRWDGTPYAPREEGIGLLATANAAIWQPIRDALPIT